MSKKKRRGSTSYSAGKRSGRGTAFSVGSKKKRKINGEEK
ncbi:unnamed protein product [marine sediment metagenome]|uniref:Uncharacterized protein n=1 Tax=marine sediment metagenome TaxID=412755 RepID=X0SKY3_9ZZZZ